MNEDLASSFSSMIFIGTGAVLRFLAYLPEKCRNRSYEILTPYICIMSISFMLLFAQVGGIYAVTIILFIIGVASVYHVLLFYKVISQESNNLVGFTTAVSNTIIMTFVFYPYTDCTDI